jgi:hypothetical protein
MVLALVDLYFSYSDKAPPIDEWVPIPPAEFLFSMLSSCASQWPPLQPSNSTQPLYSSGSRRRNASSSGRHMPYGAQAPSSPGDTRPPMTYADNANAPERDPVDVTPHHHKDCRTIPHSGATCHGSGDRTPFLPCVAARTSSPESKLLLSSSSMPQPLLRPPQSTRTKQRA